MARSDDDLDRRIDRTVERLTHLERSVEWMLTDLLPDVAVTPGVARGDGQGPRRRQPTELGRVTQLDVHYAPEEDDGEWRAYSVTAEGPTGSFHLTLMVDGDQLLRNLGEGNRGRAASDLDGV